MKYLPLSTVRHRVAIGLALPFNVFNRDHTLLLAKGQVVDSLEQMQALFDRGMLVELAELFASAESIAQAPRELLPALWHDHLSNLSSALWTCDSGSFRAALDDASAPVSSLIARDPELAIFQVMRQNDSVNSRYGVEHSLHAAIVSQLVARRLGWSADELTLAFKAALTMNISMLELQGRLASQITPPTERQRRDILSHPLRSKAMLEEAGVEDSKWLEAVEQHHERPDGNGYPFALTAPCELASLLQRADIYVTKLTPRAGREAMSADRAGREMFMSDPSNPINAALVKEFGVYPPGCFVKLVSGETGLVVARGPTVMAPIVAALTDVRGRPHPTPVRRDTTERAHAVSCVLPAKSVRTRLTAVEIAVMPLA